MGGMEDWAWLQLALRVLTRSRLLISPRKKKDIESRQRWKMRGRNVLAFERGGFEFGQ
jgi:hypothetical protein